MNRMRLIWCLTAVAVLILGGCDRQAQQNAEPLVREVVRIEAPPSASIGGTLQVEDREDFSGLFVYVKGTSLMAVTGDDGVFELSGLREGEYSLEANGFGLEPLDLGSVLVTAEDYDKPQPFQDIGSFTLRELEVPSVAYGTARGAGLGVIRGQVTATNPLDVEDVTVELAGTPFRTMTNDTGSFTILNVPEGTYEVVFRQDDYRTARRRVAVTGGQETVVPAQRLQLADPQQLQQLSISGRVRMVDLEGSPVQEYDLVTVFLPGTPFSTTPDQQGNYQFVDLPEGVYVVSAEAEGYLLDRTYQVNLGDVAAAEVNLLLRQDPAVVQEGGILAGQVVLSDQSPGAYSGIQVTLSGTSASATTDSEGYFLIENLQPGTYEVVASFSGYEPARLSGIEVLADEPAVAEPIVLEPMVDAPEVARTNPAPGATDVTILRLTPVDIVFTQDMNPETLERAISVRPEVDYRIQTGSDRVRLLLVGFGGDGTPLKFDTRYTVSVSTAAENREGVPMEEEFVMTFTTGEAKVIATQPPDGAENIFVNQANPIRIYFNAVVSEDGFDPDDIRIRPEIGEQPNAYLQYDRETGWSYLTISNFFAYDEEYEVTLRGGLETITGQRISNLPYSFEFTTTTRTEGTRSFDPQNRRERLEQERQRY